MTDGAKKKRGMKGYLILNVVLFVVANSAALLYGLRTRAPASEEEAAATTEAAAAADTEALATGAEEAVEDPSTELRKVLADNEKRLEALNSENRELRDSRMTFDVDGSKQLTRIFAAMKQDKLGPIVADLDDDTLLLLVANLKDREAAKVLAALSPPRAARIAMRLAKLHEDARRAGG